MLIFNFLIATSSVLTYSSTLLSPSAPSLSGKVARCCLLTAALMGTEQTQRRIEIYQQAEYKSVLIVQSFTELSKWD